MIGRNALHAASEVSNDYRDENVELLLEKGIDFTIKDKEGKFEKN